MAYGEVLDYFIQRSGLSRADVARKANIGRSQITDLCSGRTKEPTLLKAKAIANALGVTLQEMIDMMEQEEQED